MFVENYDTIMGAVRQRSQPILDKYHEMQRQYQVLKGKIEGRNSRGLPENFQPENLKEMYIDTADKTG